ncbi:MAG TPA: LytTR family DNA-binding domain-containing protein [Flavobacteriales bacterium]|nr:LytTR family DNA-binding domain-containing protein [Flavobacteriales bacterium]
MVTFEPLSCCAMHPLTAIIVDDEDLARENLQMLLQEYCPEINVIGKAGTVDTARKMIRELKPRVVFLDIRMPSGSEGFDLLEELREEKFFVVFVTAFKDYAVRAFNANAIHYVLKPVDIEDLRMAVGKLVEAAKTFEAYPENYTQYASTLKTLKEDIIHNKPSGKITISHAKGIKLVKDDDIRYVEADGNCSMLHFTDGSRYLDTRTLGVYEEMLNPAKFYRIHKSHIINMNELVEYISEDGYYAVLKGGVKLPVARNRVPDFTQRMKNM